MLRITVVTMIGLLACMFGPTTEAMTLARNGAAQAVIVVAEDATAPEQHAAAELAAFLEQVTGAKFEVLNDAPAEKIRLLVGPAAARAADPGFNTEGLGTDGLVIRTVGSDLILAGGRPRGTLYAVYTFLEDEVGCRWWTPSVNHVPKKPDLEIGALDVRYVPPIAQREVHWQDARDPDWVVRNKCNGPFHDQLDEKRGGVTRKWVPSLGVHTFYSLISPDKYFGEHPEWFSEVNGVRTTKNPAGQHAHLCLTNEEMRKELVKNLKEQLRQHPEATIVSVSQNDVYYGGWGNCTCSNCAALDKAAGGTPAGSLIHFVNAVAEAIEPEFPGVTVSTLAYQYTQTPPTNVAPRRNVAVRLCSMYSSFSTPLDDPENPNNAEFRHDIEGWAAIAGESAGLYVWDYTANFRHYFLPHPNLRVLGPNARFFARYGVKGVMEQGPAYDAHGTEMAPLRTWMLAKLLWNPDLDDRALMEEFLNGYYGAAGPHLLAYLDGIHDAVAARGSAYRLRPHLGYKQAAIDFLTFDVLREAWAHLKAAEAAVAEQPELAARVRLAEMPFLYTVIMTWPALKRHAEVTDAEWFLEEPVDALFARFKETAATNGVTRLTEFGRAGFGEIDTAVGAALQAEAAKAAPTRPAPVQ